MFDNNKLGEIRPNQLITTFGPGSIVDAVKDSVTVLDLNYWKEKGKKIIDGRLASYLGVDCFYMPRTSYSGDIPVVSFPYMHVCSNVKCGRIFDLRENFDLDRYLKFGVTCPECHRQAYPSRFITICENGHMDDFPWSWWVHGGNTTCKGTMRMYSTGNTSTLADMWVECSCGARRSMSGATQHENFEGMKCSGHHPFRPNHKNEKCNKEMIPSQRGASNVYFPVMRSAISIPPWINPLYNLIDEHLRLIDSYEEDFGEMGLDKVYQKYFSAFTREEFDAALLRRRQNIKEFTEIKQMEYNAILVKFFVNDIESQKAFDRLCCYKGKFLRIYNYPKQEDKMSALHAKVISVDQTDTLITSANLSYHGQEGNIELGARIHSKELAKQVEDIFTSLVFKRIFVEL